MDQNEVVIVATARTALAKSFRGSFNDTEAPVLGGHVILRKFHNPGAMLGLGQNRRPVLALVSGLMTGALAIGWLRALQEKSGMLLKLAMSFLLGGALSNVWDRLRQGFVVDYFSFGVKWEPLRAIVFNISDFCILIGALIIAIKGM